MFNWQGYVLLAHHSPHMRAGEIQDESSKHEHQKVHERYLFQDLWCCEPSVLPAQRAVYDRQKRCGLLTTAKRLQLNNMVSTMNSHTVWMGEALFAAEKSQLLDPPLIKKLGALKNNMEVEHVRHTAT